jgi:pyruvate dehydrogenase E2 component (dihydrolipoamide acetyltransferase)
MSIEITMPKLSDTMEEGKILRWLKHPGDKVTHGDSLAEVETDKADMVMEAFDDGVMQEIVLAEGESAPVGAIIARMAAPGEEVKPAAPAAAAKPPADAGKKPGALRPDSGQAPAGATVSSGPAQSSRPGAQRPVAVKKRAAKESSEAEVPAPNGSAPAFAEPPSQVATETAASDGAQPRADEESPQRPFESHREPARATQEVAAMRPAAAPPRPAAVASDTDTDGGKVKASPLARRAAEEAGIDLAHVHGTGPEGRITKRDIDNFLREQQMFRQRRLVTPREGSPGTWEELSKMRRTIAQRMAASKREIPHFYVTMEIDMEEAVRLKKSLETTEIFDEAITFNDIVIKACALALGRYPRMNASFENDGIRIHPSINVGMAVAVEDGLIVPVIRECQRLTLPEIARAAHRLVAKAAQGGFTADELSGATFSISNMGMLGVEHFSAVIVPPQAAILAVSAIKERPVVRNGQLAVGTTMMLTVACDHRIVDGVVAGRFLQEMKRFLENPASLLV